jgi:hypothetical protein
MIILCNGSQVKTHFGENELYVYKVVRYTAYRINIGSQSVNKNCKYQGCFLVTTTRL